MSDIILRNGRVVDPINHVDDVLDIQIEGSVVCAVGHDVCPTSGTQIVDVSGSVVMPGIVDSHVHVSGSYVGQSARNGHRMLARAGVTSVLDMAADPDDLMSGVAELGCGLNVGFVVPAVPGDTVPVSGSISRSDAEAFVNYARSVGAVGVKLLGGHFPITPDEMDRIITAASESESHVAIHAGSSAHGSNIEGLEEALNVAGSRRVHMAHINAYCRGQVMGDSVAECSRALSALNEARSTVSESYLSAYNGTSALCIDGIPRSNVVKTCLKSGGYSPSRSGLVEAIRGGWAKIHVSEGGVNSFGDPMQGIKVFEHYDSNVGVSFPVNPASTAVTLATARVPNGEFSVDAISTDGGCIPRNTILSQGLSLVDFGALSLADFVVKSSANPARLIGQNRKGHLGIGADADVTVFDPLLRRAVCSMAMGEFVLIGGVVVGSGGRYITTGEGRAYLEAAGQSISGIYSCGKGWWKDD